MRLPYPHAGSRPAARRPVWLLFVPTALLAPLDGQAQPPAGGPPSAAREVRTVPAARLAGGAVAIDGRLTEPAWQNAEAATGFTQRTPDPGAPGSQRTEVRVLYDEDALYVGMRLFDTAPDSIARQLGRRDLSGVFSDWVHVIVDSYHDRRTAFRFSLNPFGVQKDVLHFDDTNEDISWDAVWDADATVDAEGWTAEYRIPFSQLRFSSQNKGGQLQQHGEGLVWGINFGRDIARRDERSEWSYIPPDAGRYVSLCGDLTGLRGVQPPRQLEVLPYSVGQLTRAPGDPADPLFERNDLDGSKVGADFKYGITSNLTVNGTINPDFGQVEADPSIVNLSAFETVFPEKRPFFIEGSSIYLFDIGYDDGSQERLFHSRRVGRAPQGFPGAGAAYADMPDAATILGAAKLSGKTAGGWSVGLLEAVTGKEQAEVVTGAGARREDAVEPLTNYAVLRASRDFREGQSGIGAILTGTNRKLDDGLDFLRRSAYVAGLDGRHRYGPGNNYLVWGWVAGSHVEGSAAAIERTQRSSVHFFQREGADHVEVDPTRTSLTGWAANLWAQKVSGGHWRWLIGTHARSPEFEVNDLGYVRRVDEALTFGNLRFEQFKPGKHFRSWSLGVNPSSAWTFGGEHTWTGANLNYNFNLKSLWGGWAGGRREFGGLAIHHLRGGPALKTDPGTSVWAGFYTDSRKVVSGDWGVDGWREDGTGTWFFGTGPSVSIRPSGRMSLSLSPRIEWNQPKWEYVGTGWDGMRNRYVVGELDQTTALLTARLNYSFTRNLSLQLYGQPFLSAGDYSGFMEVREPGADRFEDRYRVIPSTALAYDPAAGEYVVDENGDSVPDYTFGNRDFNFKQFRSTMVLRWEYRPGSTLFVVWGDDRTAFDQDASFELGRDTRRLWDAEATDVFLVKLSYWLGF